MTNGEHCGDRAVPCPIAEAAQQQGDAPALVGPSVPVSYRDYEADVSASVARLLGEGLRPGERLGIRLPTCQAYPVLLMACFRLGVVACPISMRLPMDGVQKALDVAACRAALVADASSFPGVPSIPLDRLVKGPARRVAAAAIPLDRPATIVFTSGSTGGPKAALHAYGNHYHNALASNRNIPLASGDRWLLSLPLHHVSGLSILFRCMMAGATVVMPDPDEDIETALRRYGVTHVSLVATQLRRLLSTSSGREALRQLKCILLGGSGMPRPLIRAALEERLPIRTSYGLTETASQAATTRAEDRTVEALAFATPLIPGSVKVDDSGEILVKGPTLFLGYVEGPRVERPLTPDGWFRTGDLGRIDGGRLTALGRKDNMFISGGENIQPEEVERALMALDGVEQALVVPVHDDAYGRRPVAFIKTASGAVPETAALIDPLSHVLPRFKIPRTYLRWPQHLERPGQKLHRSEFAQEARRLGE